MNCPNCGNEIKNDLKFCTNCGIHLEDTPNLFPKIFLYFGLYLITLIVVYIIRNLILTNNFDIDIWNLIYFAFDYTNLALILLFSTIIFNQKKDCFKNIGLSALLIILKDIIVIFFINYFPIEYIMGMDKPIIIYTIIFICLLILLFIKRKSLVELIKTNN